MPPESGSSGLPIRFLMRSILMAPATVNSRTYSKTTCPLLVRKLMCLFMEQNPNNPQAEQAKPKRVIPIWLKLILMCAAVFLASIGYFRSLHQDNENVAQIQEGASDLPPNEKRKSVPDISLIVEKGQNKKLSDYKGKVVLLSFWASWCTPCLVELPTFIEIHEKLSSKGLVILPVNVDDPATASQFVPNFWKARNFPFETFYDPEQKGSTAFNVDSLPSNFVLDRKGNLVAQGFGANDWSNDTSMNLIRELLTE